MKKLLAVVLGLAFSLSASYAEEKKAVEKKEGDKKVEQRVFEMRIYYAAPGKMNDLHARFRNHTVKLFEKHGMKNVGYWVSVDPKEAESKLVYIVSHESKEAADKNWKSFQADPDWVKAKTESEKAGGLVAKVEKFFYYATDYSPVK